MTNLLHAGLTDEAGRASTAIGWLHRARIRRQVGGSRAAYHVNVCRLRRIQGYGSAYVCPTPAEDVLRVAITVLRVDGIVIGGGEMGEVDIDALAGEGERRAIRSGRVGGGTGDDGRGVRQHDKTAACPVTGTIMGRAAGLGIPA